MSALPRFAAVLRRKLLAQPGITALPVCGACGAETTARNWGREFCRACEAERAEVSAEWDAQRDAEIGGLRPIGILIHGGDRVTRAPFVYRVPKRDLVGIISIRLQNRTLRIGRNIPFADVLQNELLNFRVKIDPVTAHDSYAAWREGDHDDLVLAAAITLWWGDRGRVSDTGPYQVIHAKM